MGIVYEEATAPEAVLPQKARERWRAAAARAASSLPSAAFCAELDRTPPPTSRASADRVVVQGVGGSALGARAIHEARADPQALPMTVVDNIDPAVLEAAWRGGSPARTAWVVVSKSGTTTETLAQWAVVRKRLRDLRASPPIQVVTGEAGPLRDWARADKLPLHLVPEAVGGRFSVFTPAATVPLALAGHDVAAMLAGARAARANASAGGVAGRLAALLVGAYEHGRTVVTFWSYAARLQTVGAWFRQLWAESLGKRRPDGTRVGQTPVECVGSTDQHSIQQLMVEGPRDKAVLVVAGPGGEETACPADAPGPAAGHTLHAVLEAMRRATTAEMVRAGCPAATIRLDAWDCASLGALLMTFLCATVVAGRLLEVDPFGQPGVEAAKAATKLLLSATGGTAATEIAALLGEGRGLRCP
ncbi:MAG: glucose-6-phosphate isomerase [Planctomycetaceae bacterium]